MPTSMDLLSGGKYSCHLSIPLGGAVPKCCPHFRYLSAMTIGGCTMYIPNSVLASLRDSTTPTPVPRSYPFPRTCQWPRSQMTVRRTVRAKLSLFKIISSLSNIYNDKFFPLKITSSLGCWYIRQMDPPPLALDDPCWKFIFSLNRA